MTSYARIQEGKVVEIITLTQVDEDGKEKPVELCYAPEFVESLVDITNLSSAPSEGFNYNNGVFSAPVEVVPQFTKEEIEKFRLIAYSDPVNGCDRYFSESICLQAEGFAVSSTEVKEAKAKGLARKLEIQTLYPYPV